MSDYEKRIDKIRKYFENHKAERYPFENELLIEKDEYVKSLYFRMLCTLVRYTGDPDEMQILYIRRLIAGSHAENDFQDYMRMALDLDTEDIDEFISVFKEDDLRYYFCIDGAIVLSIGNMADKNYELFAELVEFLGISRDEIAYFATVSKAIISRDVVMFDGARDFAPENVKTLSMYQYIRDFYVGKIVDSNNKIHIYSYEKSNTMLNRTIFKNKKVVIENAILSLTDDITFEGCERVLLKNCTFIGEKDKKLLFVGCKEIIVEKCQCKFFKKPIFEIERSPKISIQNCEFFDCNIYNSLRNSGPVGIIIHVNDNPQNTKGYIEKSVFKNCCSQAGNCHTVAIGLLANCVCEVNESKFYNLQHYTYDHYDSYSLVDDSRQRLFINGSKGENNELVGCPSF